MYNGPLPPPVPMTTEKPSRSSFLTPQESPFALGQEGIPKWLEGFSKSPYAKSMLAKNGMVGPQPPMAFPPPTMPGQVLQTPSSMMNPLPAWASTSRPF